MLLVVEVWNAVSLLEDLIVVQRSLFGPKHLCVVEGLLLIAVEVVFNKRRLLLQVPVSTQNNVLLRLLFIRRALMAQLQTAADFELRPPIPLNPV